MPPHFIVECLDCQYQAPYSPTATACPRCKSDWREARYDLSSLSNSLLPDLERRPFNLWRYRELLPIRTRKPELTLGEGGTPLIRAVNLGMMLGCPNIYIKDERQGPTSSFKDRQAAVTIAALKEAGITEAVIASTGNVAISYSAYAARAGIKLWAFLTSLVPAEKMREVAIYGTQVVKVTSTYDQAKQVAAEYARQRGLYIDRGSRSIPSVEAMKTIAYEISEQLGEWVGGSNSSQGKGNTTTPLTNPDWYLQAVSGGLGPLGVLKGFSELKADEPDRASPGLWNHSNRGLCSHGPRLECREGYRGPNPVSTIPYCDFIHRGSWSDLYLIKTPDALRRLYCRFRFRSISSHPYCGKDGRDFDRTCRRSGFRRIDQIGS